MFVFNIFSYGVIKHLINYVKERREAREDNHVSEEEEKKIDEAAEKLYGSVIKTVLSLFKIKKKGFTYKK